MKKLLTLLALILVVSATAQTKQKKGESLMLDWPDSENWIAANSQGNDKMTVVELIHSDETLENWTEFGYMMSLNITGVSVEKAMNVTYEQAKVSAPKAKLTLIEKDEAAEHPWIIFMIESPEFTDSKSPESQVWYVVQGKTALYSNFRAVKEATISAEMKDKWVSFFKTAKIVNKK